MGGVAGAVVEGEDGVDVARGGGVFAQEDGPGVERGGVEGAEGVRGVSGEGVREGEVACVVFISVCGVRGFALGVPSSAESGAGLAGWVRGRLGPVMM